MSIELVMSSNQLILRCPLLLPPSVFPSIRVFSKESVLRIRWPKYGHFSFNISPSNDYSGLISFKGLSRVFSKHHNSKASLLQHSAFFIVSLAHPYMTTGKTINLTRWTFVSKVMSLLFNKYTVRVGHSFSSKKQASFNFMAVVTISSDFGAQENNLFPYIFAMK